MVLPDPEQMQPSKTQTDKEGRDAEFNDYIYWGTPSTRLFMAHTKIEDHENGTKAICTDYMRGATMALFFEKNSCTSISSRSACWQKAEGHDVVSFTVDDDSVRLVTDPAETITRMMFPPKYPMYLSIGKSKAIQTIQIDPQMHDDVRTFELPRSGIESVFLGVPSGYDITLVGSILLVANLVTMFDGNGMALHVLACLHKSRLRKTGTHDLYNIPITLTAARYCMMKLIVASNDEVSVFADTMAKNAASVSPREESNTHITIRRGIITSYHVRIVIPMQKGRPISKEEKEPLVTIDKQSAKAVRILSANYLGMEESPFYLYVLPRIWMDFRLPYEDEHPAFPEAVAGSRCPLEEIVKSDPSYELEEYSIRYNRVWFVQNSIITKYC